LISEIVIVLAVIAGCNGGEIGGKKGWKKLRI
jgi:hypothetical protein